MRRHPVLFLCALALVAVACGRRSDERTYTLSMGLQRFVSQHGAEWAMLMAASTIMTVPIIVLFFFAQRTFIQGISTTGLK